ncbi:DUF3352 domain-containing protein [Candidatus Peregrinibacteria bacterium]|nr:DUF3352 domain-containing protein [Candidatus Peregrinibacteria bacterium]
MTQKVKSKLIKAPSKSKKQTAALRQWILTLSGSVLCLAIIATAFFFLFHSRRSSAAAYLPAQETLGYLEISGQSAPAALQPFLKGHDWIDLFAPFFTSFLDQADLNQFFYEGGAVAFIKIEDRVSPVVLLPVRNREAIDLYFKQSNTLSSVTVGPYLAIAKDAKALETVLTPVSGSLKEESLFEKSSSQLPRKPWIRGYLKSSSFDSLLSFAINKTFKDLSGPLEKIIDHVSFTIQQDQQGLKFNTYSAFRPEILEAQEDDTISFPASSYKLTEFLSAENLLTYIGGANLDQEWQNTLQTLQNINPSYAIIFEGLLGAQVKRLFGDAVHLRNDLYPLFDGEYALGISAPKNSTFDPAPLQVQLVLAHTDRAFAETKMKKMIDGFRGVGAQFVPRLEIHDLPDGTQTKILVADPNRMKERNENYKGFPVACIEITDSVYGFCYSVMEKAVVMSNTFAGVQQSIDLSLQPRFVLSQHQPFRKGLSRLAQVNDQMTFLNLEGLKSLGFPWLAPFSSTTWVKQFFRDGMSAEGYLLLK